MSTEIAVRTWSLALAGDIVQKVFAGNLFSADKKAAIQVSIAAAISESPVGDLYAAAVDCHDLGCSCHICGEKFDRLRAAVDEMEGR